MITTSVPRTHVDRRFLDADEELLTPFQPLSGYADRPLVSLEKSVANLPIQIPHIDEMVQTALESTKNPVDSLTQDEKAAIYLYTMDNSPSFCSELNKTLRAEDRNKIKSWFPYLKLIMTALSKIPSTYRTVWRGVKEDLHENYKKGEKITWWAFASCTSSIEIYQDQQFIDKSCKCTLFSIECSSGKGIRHYSRYPLEEEILLLPGTRLEVIAQFSIQKDVHIIHLRELKSSWTIPNGILHISHNTRWTFRTVTVAGGHGFGATLKQLDNPCSIYIDDNQSVLVADYSNHRIVEWKFGATSGTVIAGGNNAGNQPNQLDCPSDVTVDKETNRVIICDLKNKRVIEWPRRNGTTGKTLIENISCSGLAIDYQRNLYVTDIEKDEVRRFQLRTTNNGLEADATGTLMAGGNGKGNGFNQLNTPTYICVDRDLTVYVADRRNHRVMKWVKDAQEGTVAAGVQEQGKELSQLDSPRGVVVDSLGTLYVADFGNHRIMRWCKGTSSTSMIAGGKDYQGVNRLNRPINLSFDKYGNLYVVDCLNHRILRYPTRGIIRPSID